MDTCSVETIFYTEVDLKVMNIHNYEFCKRNYEYSQL